MLVIGLLGGVASGKSLVASQLEQLGATHLDADLAGHQVLAQPEIVSALVARWGTEILNPAGEIDRSRVAAIVFAPTVDASKELQALERLTHPEIERLLRQQVQQCHAAGCPAVVLDAPVMVKAGWVAWCDHILYVDAPRDVRLARARQRGWSDSEFERREASQTPLDAKRAAASAVIDNSGDKQATLRQVLAYWENLPIDQPRQDSMPGDSPHL